DVQARVVLQQPVAVDHLAGGQAGGDGGRVVGHHVGDAPAVAAVAVAGRADLGEAGRVAAGAALGVGKVRVGPADGLVALHAQLAAAGGHAGQHAEGAGVVGPAADERAARRGLAGDVVVVGLQRVGHVGAARQVERAHV